VVPSRTAVAGASNPLRVLPAVLALADLQPRLHQVLARSGAGEDDLVAALQLDPLAVLRGLRAAHAPVFRLSPALPSIRHMVQTLGLANSRRLLACPPVTAAADAPVRALWRHSVATAIAAHDLATHTGLMDPDAAYLLGLVGDLPAWLAALRTTFALDTAGMSASECVAHWQLPTALAAQLHGSRMVPSTDAMSWMPTDVASLLRAARRLADLVAAGTRPGIDRADLDAADRVRHRFVAAMARFELPVEPGAATGDPMPAPGGPVPATSEPRLAGQRRGSLDEVVLSVLGCTRSECYRGIVTSLTAAALRYGDYDRVFYAKWLPRTGVVTVRSKADASARRIALGRFQTSANEAAALHAALADGLPVVLQAAQRTNAGLMAGLAVDELLAVPLNAALQQPSFLLMDRSLTLGAIDPERDRPMAATLAQVGSLLNENLLLRRRRQRAQKFALTDQLTRLFNRRMGILALEQEMARSERSTRPVTLLMCDLDHFKQLNDTLGHVQGDHALRATADVLRQTLRKGDTICRYGGEEFLIVLPDTPSADATVLAARLFTAVHRRGEELGLPISISIGLTDHRRGDTVEAMLHRADHALYASKGYGRNRFSADTEPSDDPVAGRV
jgi:diguanylate cyclase (GGDEF)-like protein